MVFLLLSRRYLKVFHYYYILTMPICRDCNFFFLDLLWIKCFHADFLRGPLDIVTCQLKAPKNRFIREMNPDARLARGTIHVWARIEKMSPPTAFSLFPSLFISLHGLCDQKTKEKPQLRTEMIEVPRLVIKMFKRYLNIIAAANTSSLNLKRT